MKDRAGNELTPGDHVLYLEPGTSNSRLVWGYVIRFTPKMVVVSNKPDLTNEIRRHAASVVKPYKEECPYDCEYCHPDDDA